MDERNMANDPLSNRHKVTTLHSLEQLLTPFDAIGLDGIQDAALLDRVDTKYIMGLDQLMSILPLVTQDYAALTIHDHRVHAYQTLYFDTRAFRFYNQHHNGIASRYKVRERRYVGTDTAFLEIKHRTNQQRTIKSRLPIPNLVTRLDEQMIDFALTHASPDSDFLEPKLWNEYMRVTLVSKDEPERVTLDLDLSYHWKDQCAELPGIIIVEVKQARRSQPSAFIRQMRRLGIRSTSYSKYAAGVYSLYDGVKTNNFKPQMRHIDKITQKVLHYEHAQ